MGKKKSGKQVSKIGIYVPNHRLKDVEKWRDSMNFSELFWSAFDREVVLQSKTSKVKGKDMKMVIDRLKRETSEDFDGGREVGIDYGIEWAEETGGLSDIRGIAECVITFDTEPIDKFLTRKYAEFGHDPGWFDACLDSRNDFFVTFEYLPSDLDGFKKGFEAGFIKGVQSVWEKISVAF